MIYTSYMESKVQETRYANTKAVASSIIREYLPLIRIDRVCCS